MALKIQRYDTKSETYSALIRHLGVEMDSILTRSSHPVLALPTGTTMIPLYRLLCQNAGALKIAKWKCFQLDEYYPLSDASEALSFQCYLRNHFYTQIIEPPALCEALNGFTTDPDAECARYEDRIKAEGGLDLAILGIGRNGHIAFNEPGSPFDSRTRLTSLHPETLASNFKEMPAFTNAMTLGIGTLLEAKKIWVVAVSASKTEAIRRAIHEPPTTSVPASALQSHRDVTWFLDAEAYDGNPSSG